MFMVTKTNFQKVATFVAIGGGATGVSARASIHFVSDCCPYAPPFTSPTPGFNGKRALQYSDQAAKNASGNIMKCFQFLHAKKYCGKGTETSKGCPLTNSLVHHPCYSKDGQIPSSHKSTAAAPNECATKGYTWTSTADREAQRQTRGLYCEQLCKKRASFDAALGACVAWSYFEKDGTSKFEAECWHGFALDENKTGTFFSNPGYGCSGTGTAKIVLTATGGTSGSHTHTAAGCADETAELPPVPLSHNLRCDYRHHNKSCTRKNKRGSS